MIYYVVPKNPDNRVLEKACQSLRADQIICFSTDTNWVFGASLDSKKAIDSLYRIKGMDKKKHLILLCNNISQASTYAFIGDSCYRQIRSKVPGPFTFIFRPSMKLPRSIRDYKKENQIGIRIPKSTLCERLVSYWGEPILTTSISPEMVGIPFDDDKKNSSRDLFSYQIEEAFPMIDIIIDSGEFEHLGPSSIVDFSNDLEVPMILREGIGDINSFRAKN